MDDTAEVIIVSVKRCARCGGDHDNMVFKRLAKPVDMDGMCTHWVMCPTNQEPILMETHITDGENV